MTDDIRDLLAGDALDALSSDDAERLERELAASPELQRERDAYRATVAALDKGVARMQPPDTLFDRILTEVEAGDGSREPGEVPVSGEVPVPTAPARRRRAWLPRLALTGAAVTAVLVVALLVREGGDAPDARATVAGTERFPEVGGTAELFAPAEPGGVLRLRLENLPEPPVGSHYEVWVLREEAGEAMESVGSFTPTSTDERLELPLPGPGSFRAVDVSVEPDGGSPEHSGVSLAGGTFELS